MWPSTFESHKPSFAAIGMLWWTSAAMRDSRTTSCAAMLAVVVIWLLLAAPEAKSGKIDSQALLVGNWNTTIRCTNSWFTSELFPPCTTRDASPRTRKRWERPRDFQCSLSLYPNGTFGLQPQDHEWAAHHLPVHGLWSLDPNPYCVTDRFYDEVVLQSYPRIQKRVMDGQEEILQTVSLDLQCRLTGHFSHGRRLRAFCGSDSDPPFARGKLSHGVFLLSREQSPAEQQASSARRKIAATFAARRDIPSRRDLDKSEEDSAEFGY